MDFMLLARIAAAVVAAYLLGAIPWALIIGKTFYRIDVRTAGSGNLGATNVMRVLGWKAALGTFVLDVGKGALAVWLAGALVTGQLYGAMPQEGAMILATLAAMAGHAFSPYIGFRGGKGVAVAAGGLLVLVPPIWIVLFASFLIIVAISRMVSLGSMIIAVEFPVLVFLFYGGNWPLLAFAVLAAGLVIWRHSANIGRILRGEESKISLRPGSAVDQKDGDE